MKKLHRRDLLAGALVLPVALDAARRRFGISAATAAEPFSAERVKELARALATKPWQASKDALSPTLAKIGYDDYRALRFKPDQALWAGQDLPFTVHLFHRGFLYKERVEIFEVDNGIAQPVAYRPEMFDLSKIGSVAEGDRGFAGFRLHAPMNRPDYHDEVAVFLGASYFRAVGKHHRYGLSARGLAIKTAEQTGEEFPRFTSFWLEKPRSQAGEIVIHALLDSRSTTGAYRFAIRPGEATIVEVESTLFPRVEIAQVGIAPLTSMFFFAASDRGGIDDFRPSVHDSDGLSIWTGSGEQIWRPISNPGLLQAANFLDVDPRGFGLMQRQRSFAAFQDLEARYERRPSLWIETLGKWGKGGVSLIEIPTTSEIHDNIVAFWRPEKPLAAKGEHSFAYRMHWCWDAPWKSDLAHVTDTRIGASFVQNRWLFVIETEGDVLRRDAKDRRGQVEANAGKIHNVVSQLNPVTGGWRLSFELEPESARVIELRARLMDGDQPVSETWLYRWTR
ncbi:MAG: opgG [Alphaproteobacteria bacterium]|nr:opgG [Alphaproteobacteria bacterium]